MKVKAVVCGGGLMGLSAAYHLARRGATVFLFEKECIGSHGGSRASVGMVTAPMFYQHVTLQQIAQHSAELYSKLSDNGEEFKYSKCGRLYLSNSKATEMQLKRMLSRLSIRNSESQMISSLDEIRSRWPMLSVDGLQCALYSPDDVSVDVVGLCRALSEGAQQAGAQIFECSAVKRVLLSDTQHVYAVDTDEGLVETSIFINAAGIWSSAIPVKGVPEGYIKVAAHPCNYTFLSTDRLPNAGIGDESPFIVDCDEKVYIAPGSSRTVCGGFAESDAPPLNNASHTNSADWNVPCPDWDNFHSVLNRLMRRCPSLSGVSHGDLVSGAEMFTPDMLPIVGESMQARGYYVCNGLNGQGVTLAGGLGRIFADWVLTGQPPVDVSKIEATRFLPLHMNPQYLFERVPEVSSYMFTNLYHSHQCHSARNLRMSPIYHQLRAAGAMFGEIMGYERPLWYNHRPASNTSAAGGNFMPTTTNYSNKDAHDDEKPITTSTALNGGGLFCGQDQLDSRPIWFADVMKEYEACRERVGLIDMSSFAKFDVSGPDVLRLLQWVCSANIERPVGTTVYTGMQNDSGGYVTDCTMSRIREDAYFIVAPTVQQIRLANWLRRWITEMNLDVQVQDVTGLYTALNIVGPSARFLMEDITSRPMTSSDFPSFAFRELDVGMAAGIRAISVTHCGELGWVLYVPNEVAQNVYERVVHAGAEYSMQHAGYYTLRHLRIEKFYVYWGQDISNTTTPIECGRSFRVDFNKEFVGKQALLKIMDRGVTRRFVQVLVDKHKMDQDPWPQGGEPLFRNGKLSGWTTSAAYGFTLGTHVCLGYLENEEFGVSPEFITNGSYQIEIGAKRFPVRLNLHSPSLPMISSEHPHHYRPTQK